ncbi:1-acyl-sn-glycerol-3-phosphate acyltransferase [Trichostrongylus colubriformis]|uniref:1-acyl-sn-glycerol-3-phosphate acyltransferase n=1 Tax=Trichostrongylus colubriformis TaxID=6319 RepID=A0AAN8G7N7_TRICO
MTDADGKDDYSCHCYLLTISAICAALILTYISLTVRFYVKVTLYLMSIIAAGTVGGIMSLPFGRTPNNHFRMFAVFHSFCSFLQLRFILRNKHYLDSDKAFILIANHQSAVDVLGMSYCWPKNCVVMLKSSLKYLPGFNLCAYMCNAIFINRFSKEKAHKALDSTLDAITKEHRKVWIYPEGTRNPGSSMLPFKKGAFVLSMEAKVPVVCCVFSSHSFFYDAAKRKFDSGDCLVEFLPPIDPSNFKSVEELSDHCRNQMMAKFDELNKEMRSRVSDKDK